MIDHVILGPDTNLKLKPLKSLLPILSSWKKGPSPISNANFSVSLIWQDFDSNGCCKECFKLAAASLEQNMASSALFFTVEPGKIFSLILS